MLMKYASVSDSQLKDWLQGTGSQFRNAVKYLCKTELPKVVSVLKRYRCSEPEAEELFQDALLVLAENIGRIEIHKSLSGYIKGICIKRHISKSRKKGLDIVSADAENAPEIRDIAAELDAMDLTLESDNEDREFVEALRSAMSELSPKCREALEERYFEGASIPEMAESEEINPQSVSNKLHRCIGNLRKIVESNPYLERILRARL